MTSAIGAIAILKFKLGSCIYYSRARNSQAQDQTIIPKTWRSK